MWLTTAGATSAFSSTASPATGTSTVTVSTGEAAVPVRIQYSAVPIQRGCGGEGWRHRLGTASSHWRAVRARLGMQSAALGSDPQVSPVPVPELVCAGHSPVRRGAGGRCTERSGCRAS